MPTPAEEAFTPDNTSTGTAEKRNDLSSKGNISAEVDTSLPGGRRRKSRKVRKSRKGRKGSKGRKTRK